MIPLKDTVPSRSFPLVNWLLIGLNVLVFMGELRAAAAGQLEDIVYAFGVIPARFLYYCDAHEVMTLFTSMFLHGGWLHLFSNMLALYIFGDNTEDRLGPGRYLLFYLLCGVAAELTQVFINPNSLVPTIGASGAIAGVLGAYLVLFPHARVITLIPIFFLPWILEIPAVVYLGFWFLSQLLSGTLQIAASAETGERGGVAFWAHVGGFATGALVVWLFAIPQRKVRRRYVDEYAPW